MDKEQLFDLIKTPEDSWKNPTKSTLYYLDAYDVFLQGKFKFNWASAFMPFWFSYRGMYGLGLISMLIVVICSLSTLLGLMFLLACGFFGNTIYFRYLSLVKKPVRSNNLFSRLAILLLALLATLFAVYIMVAFNPFVLQMFLTTPGLIVLNIVPVLVAIASLFFTIKFYLNEEEISIQNSIKKIFFEEWHISKDKKSSD